MKGKVEFSQKERNLLRELQNGFKLEGHPFKRLARDLGYTEDEVIETIRRFTESGVIRRIGVAVRPEKVGHRSNAMISWDVPAERVEEVCKTMSLRPEISHCYDRDCPPNWVGNVFTMVHAHDEAHLAKILGEIREVTGLQPHQIFRSVRELKKTSMRYFTDEEEKQ